MSNYRSLLMRANRRMGASLVDHNLVDVSDLEAANERLLELVNEGIGRRSSILGLLVTEMNAVDEKDLIAKQVDEFNIAPFPLGAAEREEAFFKDLDTALLWATWTVPFDEQDGFTFLASAYYLSSFVREYWEERIEGEVLWYVAALQDIAEVIEWREKESVKK